MEYLYRTFYRFIFYDRITNSCLKDLNIQVAIIQLFSLKKGRSLIVCKSKPFVFSKKQLLVPNKKWRHKIQMTNDRPVYILPLVNYSAYWPIIDYLYYMTSFYIRHYKLLLFYINLTWLYVSRISVTSLGSFFYLQRTEKIS